MWETSSSVAAEVGVRRRVNAGEKVAARLACMVGAVDAGRVGRRSSGRLKQELLAHAQMRHLDVDAAVGDRPAW